MSQLALVRHGQSEYNLKNLFTGWVDVDLSEQGIAEAHKTGLSLKERGFKPQVCFTSELKRAQKTLGIILADLKLENLPITKSQALNERHYGKLQGKNKKETAEEFGEEQVHIWRRSYDVAPPEGESLKDTAARAVPYFKSIILPVLREAKDVLVVAHGNSLRALIMEIEKLSPEEILKRELSTGEATLYNFSQMANADKFQLIEVRR